MGANSKCYLPNDVNASDVVEAIAFLCGADRERWELSGLKGSFATSVNYKQVSIAPNKKYSKKYAVQVQPTHDIGYHIIFIAPTTCDKSHHNGDLFTYSSDENPGYILLYGGVSDFWKQIDRALVDMFGGYVDDDDCDSVDVDYRKRKPRKSNHPSSGEAWQKYQDDMYNLPKLFEFVD